MKMPWYMTVRELKETYPRAFKTLERAYIKQHNSDFFNDCSDCILNDLWIKYQADDIPNKTFFRVLDKLLFDFAYPRKSDTRNFVYLLHKAANKEALDQEKIESEKCKWQNTTA